MIFKLRDMESTDVAPAYWLSQHVQWPHRLEDWQQAWSLGGGVIAEASGEVAGCALRWLWGEHRATLGLVIVAEQHRGQGIARAMMQQLMAPLSTYQLQLVASDQGKPLYQQLGFVEQGTLAQHQCRELPLRDAAPLPNGLSLRPALPADIGLLSELDLLASGMQRQPLLVELLASAGQALVLERQGIAVGFALRRRFGYGSMIGPVVASDPADAIALIDSLCQPCGGQFVRVDTPLVSGLSPWLNQRGLPCVDTPTIMVRGTPYRPDYSLAQTFALVSQAWS
ncbi:GNAT family N-acetyltransferase [Serratia proteamaculans]|uniref:GNAT family N-acetyltransferase n=1 Tax=Serratia proteamaculans TaxID=28151 RepID=UPI00217BAB93|nr:GNAT family N-acetyltransferase [Serratia proteamaculans]CAI1625502.1 Predicted acetyltransferase [Serratia proteamaculans]CAI2428521.1 Predicted acetyltransferase [Serratia proteamaculans]